MGTLTRDADSTCPNCGGPLAVRREGNTQGLFCTKCDWAVVTSILPEILGDATFYQVIVTSGDLKNESHLKTISKLINGNLLTARKLLQSGENFVVFKGSAYDVRAKRDMLAAVDLKFYVEPPFP